eukprot:4330707-Lingulodinium_polyedra.AAC.1
MKSKAMSCSGQLPQERNRSKTVQRPAMNTPSSKVALRGAYVSEASYARQTSIRLIKGEVSSGASTSLRQTVT